jgi:nucleoside-diphosphate-sugar epimerase
MELPAAIRDVAHLDELLSEPSDAAVEAMRRANGDVLVLGVAGKMGPTLARMTRRAMDAAGLPHRVIGVSRFSSPGQRRTLEAFGVETIQCELLDESALARLPDAPHVVFMAGRKFGSTGNEPLTWAMNAYLPALVCARYRSSRIVVFSTGNVYGLTPHGRGGSREGDLPLPVGEYAMSCLARERMVEYFSDTAGIPVVILRLNYATEMRYGVLVDLARRVSRREPVDVTMGYFNTIWQGDANAMALAALTHASTPASIVNIAGPEEVSVRSAASELARLLDADVTFTGREADDALLSNGSRGWALLGTADWTRRGGDHLGKPTQFESRAGRF